MYKLQGEAKAFKEETNKAKELWEDGTLIDPSWMILKRLDRIVHLLEMEDYTYDRYDSLGRLVDE